MFVSVVFVRGGGGVHCSFFRKKTHAVLLSVHSRMYVRRTVERVLLGTLFLHHITWASYFGAQRQHHTAVYTIYTYIHAYINACIRACIHSALILLPVYTLHGAEGLFFSCCDVRFGGGGGAFSVFIKIMCLPLLL